MQQGNVRIENEWQRLDSADNVADFVAYLKRLEDSEHLRSIHEVLLRKLPVNNSDRVLDLGSGIGTVARLLRSRLGSTGGVVGIDLSLTMARHAQAINRKAQVSEVQYCCGDILALPFPAGAFHGAISSRVLIHLREPLSVLREVHRVLRPGGWYCATEPDWSSISVEPDLPFTRALLKTHRESFANEGIGGRLTPMFEAAGFLDVRCDYREQVSDDLEAMWPLMNLSRSMRMAVERAGVSAREVDHWKKQMWEANKRGRFQLRIAGGSCLGRRPER